MPHVAHWVRKYYVLSGSTLSGKEMLCHIKKYCTMLGNTVRNTVTLQRNIGTCNIVTCNEHRSGGELLCHEKNSVPRKETLLYI
jgi:hypothetical protein